MDALLSVDLGTTTVKAAVYAADGRALGSHALEYDLHSPAPGWVEQDAEEWWALSLRTMREALASPQVDPRRVRAISASTQSISFVPVDRGGRLLRRALCWLDTRAGAQAARIQATVGEGRLFEITGKRPSPAYVLPKLLWLREHEPELAARAEKFLTPLDYLMWRLCGRAVADYSIAGGSMLLDVRTLEWSDDLLAAFDLDQRRLPELAWAGTLLGPLLPEVAERLGLPPGVAVVLGGQDQKCAALGAAIGPGLATVSLGTSSAISCLTSGPVLDPRRRVPTFPFVLRGYWDLEGVVGTAGAALKWARERLFAGQEYAALDALAAQAPPGSGGVRFYPHLAGATSPQWQASARGALTGVGLGCGRAELARSVLEGIAFQIRANLDVMVELEPITQLVLFGGGARSALWRAIIADICRLPVRATQTVDVANWGASILAGLGVGLFPDAAAAQALVPLTEPVEPAEPNARRYDDLYREYRDEEWRLLEALS